MQRVDVTLTVKQRRALELLLFKYGNGGSMHSNDNQKFFMALVHGDMNEASLYAHLITKPCQEALDRILKNDYRELRVHQQKMLEDAWQEDDEIVTEGSQK